MNTEELRAQQNWSGRRHWDYTGADPAGLWKEVKGNRSREMHTTLLIVSEPTPSRFLAQGHSKDVCLGRFEATGLSMYTHVHGKEDSRAGSQAPNTSSGNSCSTPPNEHHKTKQKTCHPNNPSWFTRREGVLKIEYEETFKICKSFHWQRVNNL